MSLTQFYINGQWVDPVTPETLDVINPATEEAVATISVGTSADVDKAVAAAKAAFPSYSATSVQERVELLTTIRETYKKRFDDVADAIQMEMGAPTELARGAQAMVGMGHLKAAIRSLSNHEFEFTHGQFLIRHEPIGVCGLITPWNWPVNQIAAKLAPCLAAGCTAILKPSEIAPLSAMVIAEIMHEAGVPAGVFNLVNGYGPVVGEAMSSHKDIDMMSFTGSTRGGVAVAKASAETVKRVSQELGGKSANIVLDDAAFAESVANGVHGCMNNTGQSCNAPTRMLVPASRHDEALEIARQAAAENTVGDPKAEGTVVGPLVSDLQFNKVQALIEKGIEEGATLVCGGTGKPDDMNRGYYVKPTVFGHVTNDMTIAQEEIFGPVLSIIAYDDVDNAVEIANDTVYGLAAYVSGADKDDMVSIARRLRAGQIHLNYGGGGADAPFGGYKQSGNGREKAEWGLEDYLEVKAVLGA
ncbi:MAG: aldehyde dehydrogenase family protein [Alphaproteobacteria bacterium]|nr:aldehyde dehydrogenase family protein [Alphaproteobacteria bacterium]